MMHGGENHNESDLLGKSAHAEDLVLELGTAGWTGDSDADYFHKGAGEKGNVTLVNVTLYRGRTQTFDDDGNPDEPHTPDVAQGRQLVCRLGRPADGIPQRNGQVVVAFPGGFTSAPGVGIIIAAPGDPRDTQGAAAIRTTDDGAITRMTTTDGTKDGQTIYDRLDRNGWELRGPWGYIQLGPNGFHVHHTPSGTRIDLGAVSGMPTPLDALGGYAAISGPIVHVEGSIVGVGAETGASEALVKFTSFEALLAALKLAIFDGLDAVGVGSACDGPGAAAAFGAEFDASVTPLLAALPTTSVAGT